MKNKRLWNIVLICWVIVAAVYILTQPVSVEQRVWIGFAGIGLILIVIQLFVDKHTRSRK